MGRLSQTTVPPAQRHVVTDFLAMAGESHAQSQSQSQSHSHTSATQNEMGQDQHRNANHRQQNNSKKMSTHSVESVTSVLAWFGESVRHMRMDLGYGDNSIMDALASRWPESIRSSLTDLSVFCEGSVELSACLDALPTLQLPSIRCLTILLPRGRTSMPAESIGRVLRCMSQLTDLGLQIAPTMPLHSLPTLPALTALAVAWPYAWSKRKRRTHIKEHGDKSVGHHDTSALPILTIHILYIDINDMSGSLTM